MALTPEEVEFAKNVVSDVDWKLRSKRLRDKIEIEILSYSNRSDLAAIAICVLLEREIGLVGNGWFDDDPDVLAAIERERE